MRERVNQREGQTQRERGGWETQGEINHQWPVVLLHRKESMARNQTSHTYTLPLVLTSNNCLSPHRSMQPLSSGLSLYHFHYTRTLVSAILHLLIVSADLFADKYKYSLESHSSKSKASIKSHITHCGQTDIST